MEAERQATTRRLPSRACRSAGNDWPERAGICIPGTAGVGGGRRLMLSACAESRGSSDTSCPSEVPPLPVEEQINGQPIVLGP